MTTEFLRVRTVFEDALEVALADRDAFLGRACGADAALRQQVEQLLAHDREAGTMGALLDRPAATLVAAADTLVGVRIGAYRIQAVLGGGGMGTVYSAWQDEPQRLVALKVMSIGLAGASAAPRFRQEAELLARLRHPGIAQVYAVGVHAAGGLELPWFAMELVEGARDLVTFAAAANLSVRERVGLLLQACDAVHHGHLHGVIHRDLKPPNVLVDRDGRVKVIDFGIARSSEPSAVSVRTEHGFVLGTLAYMSPEQVGGHLVDLRCDVWALGVIAFELLAGKRPFQVTGLSPWQVARAIETMEAPRLRQSVRGLDADLEVVVGKALRRERGDRYASVAALADDLRAFLAQRPVAARPPSTFYHVRLFARRRRGLVLAVAAIVAVAITSFVMLSLQNIELLRKERLAARVAKFARDVLAESDAMRSRGVDYTVREALDVAAKGLATEAFPDARVEAELRQLVGDSYRSLSVVAAAEVHLARAVELWRQVGGASRQTIEAELSLVLVWREQDRLDEAQRATTALWQRGERQFGADDGLWLRIQHMQALLWRDAGRLAEAEALYREVVQHRERVLGKDDEATVATLHCLGSLLLAMSRPDEARDVLQEALTRSQRGGHGDASTWQIADNLAECWRELGDLERAAAMHGEAIAGYSQLLGPDHALTLGCGYHLLKVLQRQGDVAGLRALADDLLPRCQRTFGADNRRTLFVMAAKAFALMQNGEAAAAREVCEQAFLGHKTSLGLAHPDTVVAGHNLVSAQLGANAAAAALATAGELVAVLPTATDVPPVPRAYTHLLHAQSLAAVGRLAEAKTAAMAARVALVALLPAEHALVLAADQLLAQLP